MPQLQNKEDNVIILNLIFGIAVGYFTPIVEPKLKSLGESIMLGPIKIKDNEFDMLTLLVCMMGAHFILALIGVESSVFMMCGGALLGLFAKPIWAMLQAKSED